MFLTDTPYDIHNSSFSRLISAGHPASTDARLHDVSARPWLEPTGCSDATAGACLVKLGKCPTG